MANRNNVPSPGLSLPPVEYDSQYFNNMVRLLNYFITQQDNPGEMRGTTLTLTAQGVSQTTAINAAAMRAGSGYTISSVGTTNFIPYGATSNTVGLRFVAIKDGSGSSGTGQVILNSDWPGIPSPLAAEALEDGVQYSIVSLGTTDFTLIGASSNAVGLIFTASGPGTGTGTAVKAVQAGQVWNDSGTLKIVI